MIPSGSISLPLKKSLGYTDLLSSCFLIKFFKPWSCIVILTLLIIRKFPFFYWYKYNTVLIRIILFCPQGNRKRSVLWNFYEELGSTGQRCKLCSKILSKNMARHLRLKHPKVFRQMQGSLEKRKKPVCGKHI